MFFGPKGADYRDYGKYKIEVYIHPKAKIYRVESSTEEFAVNQNLLNMCRRFYRISMPAMLSVFPQRGLREVVGAINRGNGQLLTRLRKVGVD